MKEDLTNAGYAIIERFPVGELGFVIGESETAPSRFVTWCYRTEAPDDFFWGHYVDKRETAYKDY